MKLIAAKDFHNSKKLGITVDTKDPLFQHKDHIHTGARFQIGTSDNFKDLDAAQQENVGTLLKHGLAVLDINENRENGVIKKIDEEVKGVQKMMEAAAVKPPNLAEEVSVAVIKALVAAGVIQPKK